MAGKGYSMNEKKELLQFIIERNGYSETKGRSLWVDYTNTGRTTRTWQSLKEVFQKRILPDIRNPYFNLPQDILQNFRSSFYRSNEMHRDKKILNWKSSKSDTGPSQGQAQNKHCLDSKRSSNSSRHSSSGDRTPTFEEINEVDEVRETANPSPILSISQNNNTVLDSSEKLPDESGDLLSRSTTPDLVINLSDSLKLTPVDQAMPDIDGVNPFSNNISLQRDLNCNETPSELIEVVNYLNEAYANETKRQEQLENTDAETTLDLLNVLSDSPEILGETLKVQTQFLTESKALPLNPVLETEATAEESIATQTSDDLNHPSLTNLQKLSKVLDDNGVQQSAYLNELSDSAISGILNHVLDTETQSNKKKKLVSKVKAKTSPKKRTLKKSLAKPRRTSPKNKKDKVTQTNFPSPVNSEENCSRSVGVQADTRNANTVADIPISPSVLTHPNESLRGYSPQPGPSGLSNLNGATIPDQDLALVKSTEPPSPTIAYERQISVESAALVHTSPELKRDRLNASELNRIRDKKRKKDLQNLFGFSNGQVKVNHIGGTSSRKYPIGVQKPSASRAGHKNTPQTKYSSGDTDCEHRATSSKRRRDSTDASYVEIPTFSEGNLLAMVGGCFYPVYSGVPGNMRVVKWMPKSNGIKMRKSKRILCSSSDSESDARRRRKTLPKYTRRPATHRSSTPEIVDFPNAQMQKTYCNAVLKYYDGGSRGEAPRIRDYQRVLTHEEARMPKHTNKENRSKVYNISDSDADVVQDRQRAADTKQSELDAVPITVPAVASATHPKDIVAVSPANEDSFWKLVYKMLQRKMNQEPVPQPPLLQGKGVMMDSAVSTSDLLTDVESSIASGIAMPESAAQSQRDIVHVEMDPRSPPPNEAKLAAKPRKRRSTLAPRKSPVRRSRSGLKDGKAPGSSPAGAPPVSSALAEGECSRESIGGRESVFLKNSSGEKAHEVKKPKYSVTVQKYGEDLGNYTIENTQQTEIFLDIMKNIRDTISNAAATMNRKTANGTSETSAGAVTGIIAKEQEIFEEIKRLQNEEVIELSPETIRSTEDARESASMNGHAPAITEESALVKDAESAPPNAKEISLGKDLSPDVISETPLDIAAKTASVDETNKHKLSDSSSSLLRKVKKPQGASRIPRARNIRMRKSVRTTVSVSALTANSSHEPPVVTEEAVTQTTDVVIIAGPEDFKLGNSSSKSNSTISQANLAKVETNAVSRTSSDTIGMEVYGVLAQAMTEPTSERVSPISGSTMGSNSSSECALSSIAAADTLDDPQTQMSATVQTDTRKKKLSKRLSESDAVVRKSSRKSSLFSQPDSAEAPLKKTRNRTSIAGIGASREIQLGHMTRSAVRAVEDASRIGRRSVARNDANSALPMSPTELNEDLENLGQPILQNFRTYQTNIRCPSFKDCLREVFDSNDGSNDSDHSSLVYQPVSEITVSKGAMSLHEGCNSPLSYVSETAASENTVTHSPVSESNFYNSARLACSESCYINTTRGSHSVCSEKNVDVFEPFICVSLDSEPEISDDLSGGTSEKIDSQCPLDLFDINRNIENLNIQTEAIEMYLRKHAKIYDELIGQDDVSNYNNRHVKNMNDIPKNENVEQNSNKQCGIVNGKPRSTSEEIDNVGKDVIMSSVHCPESLPGKSALRPSGDSTATTAPPANRLGDAKRKRVSFKLTENNSSEQNKGVLPDNTRGSIFGDTELNDTDISNRLSCIVLKPTGQKQIKVNDIINNKQKATTSKLNQESLEFVNGENVGNLGEVINNIENDLDNAVLAENKKNYAEVALKDARDIVDAVVSVAHDDGILDDKTMIVCNSDVITEKSRKVTACKSKKKNKGRAKRDRNEKTTKMKKATKNPINEVDSETRSLIYKMVLSPPSVDETFVLEQSYQETAPRVLESINAAEMLSGRDNSDINGNSKLAYSTDPPYADSEDTLIIENAELDDTMIIKAELGRIASSPVTIEKEDRAFEVLSPISSEDTLILDVGVKKEKRTHKLSTSTAIDGRSSPFNIDSSDYEPFTLSFEDENAHFDTADVRTSPSSQKSMQSEYFTPHGSSPVYNKIEILPLEESKPSPRTLGQTILKTFSSWNFFSTDESQDSNQNPIGGEIKTEDLHSKD